MVNIFEHAQGDEGSPLVCESPNSGEYTLAGLLVGWSWDCKREGTPAQFTSIPSVVDWISSFVREEVNSEMRVDPTKKVKE